MNQKQIDLAETWMVGLWPDDLYLKYTGPNEWLSNMNAEDTFTVMCFFIVAEGIHA